MNDKHTIIEEILKEAQKYTTHPETTIQGGVSVTYTFSEQGLRALLSKHEDAVLERVRDIVSTSTRKMKIGQNEYARKQLDLTEKQIDDHNDFVDAWQEGHDYKQSKILKALSTTDHHTSNKSDV